MLYKNVKTGNILAPAGKTAADLMAHSPMYEAVRPTPLEEPAQEPPKEPDPPKEPKTPKNK